MQASLELLYCACHLSFPLNANHLDSTLAKLCDGHIHYDNLEVKEKFDVIPTGSIVVQVRTTKSSVWYSIVCRLALLQ